MDVDPRAAAAVAAGLAERGLDRRVAAAVLRGERIATGEGSSRQRAEERAAAAALASLAASGIEV